MTDMPHQLWITACYQLRVAGHVDAAWADWFDNCTITHQPDGTTCLAVTVTDQAMLYGLIARARDLGLTLLRVQQAVDTE